MKNNKGITLVALVVTVVVLLILAGVSINLVLGNNGIIAKAKEAQRKSAEASQNDLIGMNELAQQLEEQINGSTGNGGKTEPETVPYLPSDDFHYDTSTSVDTGLVIKDASGNEDYRIGINHGKWEKVGVLGNLKYSTYEMKYWIETVVKSLQGLVTKRFKASDVSGPVGIVSTMGKNIEASGDKDNGGGPGMMVMSMIYWCIMLSANLGVMNLLPIPALDGGRLLFLIIEWIRRKPMNPKYEGYVNMAGFMLLMLLMVVILGHDIINLF